MRFLEKFELSYLFLCVMSISLFSFQLFSTEVGAADLPIAPVSSPIVNGSGAKCSDLAAEQGGEVINQGGLSSSHLLAFQQKVRREILTPSSFQKSIYGIYRQFQLIPHQRQKEPVDSQAFLVQAIQTVQNWMFEKLVEPQRQKISQVDQLLLNQFRQGLKQYWIKHNFDNSNIYIETRYSDIPGNDPFSGKTWVLRFSSPVMNSVYHKSPTIYDIIIRQLNSNSSSLIVSVRLQRGDAASAIEGNVKDEVAVSTYGLFQHLEASFQLLALEGNEPLRLKAIRLGMGDLARLDYQIKSNLRELPIVLMSPYQQAQNDQSMEDEKDLFPISPHELAEKLHGIAHVYYFPNQESFNAEMNQLGLHYLNLHKGYFKIYYPILMGSNLVNLSQHSFLRFEDPNLWTSMIILDAHNQQQPYHKLAAFDRSRRDAKLFGIIRFLSNQVKNLSFNKLAVESGNRLPVTIREVKDISTALHFALTGQIDRLENLNAVQSASSLSASPKQRQQEEEVEHEDLLSNHLTSAAATNSSALVVEAMPASAPVAFKNVNLLQQRIEYLENELNSSQDQLKRAQDQHTEIELLFDLAIKDNAELNEKLNQMMQTVESLSQGTNYAAYATSRTAAGGLNSNTGVNTGASMNSSSNGSSNQMGTNVRIDPSLRSHWMRILAFPEKQPMLEILQAVLQIYPDRLYVSSDALRDLKDDFFADRAQFMKMLVAIVESLYSLYFPDRADGAQGQQKGSINIKEEFKKLTLFDISLSADPMTSRNARLMNMRRVEYSGRVLDAQAHLFYGKKSPDRIRIYYAIDHETRKIILHRIVSHLETSANRPE